MAFLREKERAEHPKFIIVTKDFCGLGFAKMILDAGYDCIMAYRPGDGEKDTPEEFKAVGTGLVKRFPLEKIFDNREEFRDAYWIFDSNHHFKEGQVLHDEGYRIWGGQELQNRMEHDRDFGVGLAKAAGLETPETHEFKTPEEGIKFLEQDEERAWVFKPNEQDAAWDTYVPDAEQDEPANKELRTYMASLPAGNGKGFILQERKKGVEANFEIWVYEGTPFFAFCDLESKKKLNDDYGCLVGGAQDVGFVVPVESKGIQETVAKLLTTPELASYTGFLDVNVIISDRGNYFLEFCARFGYPAHPTLFHTLALDPFPELIMDMIDGKVEGFEKRFSVGFGAGITLYTDKQKKGYPIYVAEQADKKFFPYDTYKKDDLLLTAGLAPEVGVITGKGYTIKDAGEEAIKNRDRVNFPNRSARSDVAKNDYPSAPQGRYNALVAMKYV